MSWEQDLAGALIEGWPGLLSGELIAFPVRRLNSNGHAMDKLVWDAWVLGIAHKDRYMEWAKAQGRSVPPPEVLHHTLSNFNMCGISNVCFHLNKLGARVDGWGRVPTMPDSMVVQIWTPAARECFNCGAPKEKDRTSCRYCQVHH